MDKRQVSDMKFNNNPYQPTAESNRSGDRLAALDDTRFDPAHWFLPKGDLLGFVHLVFEL